MIAPDVESKIREKVLSWEAGNGYTNRACALARLRTVALVNDDRNLAQVGADYGLTYAESIGVMRGWDRAAGDRVCFDAWVKFGPGREHVLELAEGEALGARLYAECVALGKVSS